MDLFNVEFIAIIVLSFFVIILIIALFVNISIQVELKFELEEALEINNSLKNELRFRLKVNKTLREGLDAFNNKKISMLKMFDNLKIFKKKSRAQIVSEKAESILHDILISGFTNDEISTILVTLRKEGKSVLENRQIGLTGELHDTINAINRL